MNKKFQIVIIGGGNAGLSAASQLLLKDKTIEIAIVEPSKKHYYQPAWTLVGGGEFDIMKTEKEEQDYIPDGTTWIKEKCIAFEPEQNKVVLENGLKLEYDYLIVAPGIQLDYFKIKGAQETLGKNGVSSNYLFNLAPKTWEFAQQVKPGDNVLFTNPNTPIKCGGAPQKIMYLLCDYWKSKGILNDISVNFYSGGGIIFGVKKYADTLNKVIERYGIKTHFKHNLVEVDGPNKKAFFINENNEKVEVSFNFMHLTPPQSAPDFIKKSPLAILDATTSTNPCLGQVDIPANYLGWVDVNKFTLQHNRYANIFSCGDACSTPNAKTGAAIRKQVPVMVDNIISLIKNHKIGETQYNGYGSCPLITGKNKLVLAEFDYDNNPVETFPFDQGKERWSMYQMKKKLLPWLYWHRILQGRA